MDIALDKGPEPYKGRSRRRVRFDGALISELPLSPWLTMAAVLLPKRLSPTDLVGDGRISRRGDVKTQAVLEEWPSLEGHPDKELERISEVT